VVLVVEDSPDLGAILATALENEDCTVHVVSSGTAAVETAQRVLPDLITLDLGLPGLSGAEVVGALRAEPETRGIPIVAVTARSREIAPTLRAQLTAVIPKPFYLSEVLSVVMDTLGPRPGPSDREPPL
jgi:CheY-like chemotaxis protein